LKFYLQELDSRANYSDAEGYRSVHIPSVSVPRDIVDGEMVEAREGSEGYVVDVYEYGIHLRGRDFVNERFLPIASYWIDTQLRDIQAGTWPETAGLMAENH
jgi:hypothetical protein